MSNEAPKKVTFLIYDGMTLLDAIGPHEVLVNSPYFEVEFVSRDGKPITNDHRTLTLVPSRSLTEVENTDILLVPGGPGDQALMNDEETLAHLCRLDETTLYTVSVCTGSLILAAAGILRGKKASTHWAYRDELKKRGVTPARKRFEQDGKYITAAGVSAGIDLALHLVSLIAGRAHAKELQFGIEYFPNRYDILNPSTLPEFALEKPAEKMRSTIQRIREGAFRTREARP